MGDPGAVEGNKTACVDGADEDVLGDEYALIPEEDLVAARVGVGKVLALADALEPVIVGVGTVGAFEPFVDEHVGSVVVELLADELAHRETRGNKLGVEPAGHNGRALAGAVVGGGRAGDVRGEEEILGVQVKRRVRYRGGQCCCKTVT